MFISLGILAAVTAVHLGAQLLGHWPTADLTQILLMPATAAVLLSATAQARRDSRIHGVQRGASTVRATTGGQRRLLVLALVALGFSWLGDTAPRFLSGDAAFLALVGFFLVAQLVYAAAFLPFWRRSLLVRPWWLLPYLAAAVLIGALCAPAAGALLPLVLVYAAAIVTMAVLATGLGRLAGIGAAVFVVSDSLIALNTFEVLTLPAHGFWVMLTYIAAQLLLVLAIVRQQQLPDAQPRRS